MGSGSSKEKAPPVKKSVPVQNEKKSLAQFQKTQSIEGDSKAVKNNGQGWSTEKQSLTVTNKTSNNQTNKKISGFESDSSSEDDIDAVLEATKNEYNNKMQADRRMYDNNNETSYPESYAQRLQRQQYKHEPQGLLRQKTIYRNPDEWGTQEVCSSY